MKAKLCFGILLVFVAVFQMRVDGAQYLEIVKPHPLYPRKCYHSLSKKAYSVGETWQIPGRCTQFHCSKTNDNKYFITGSTCGTVGTEPPCKIVEGPKNAPYPQCCPDVECPTSKQ